MIRLAFLAALTCEMKQSKSRKETHHKSTAEEEENRNQPGQGVTYTQLITSSNLETFCKWKLLGPSSGTCRVWVEPGKEQMCLTEGTPSSEVLPPPPSYLLKASCARNNFELCFTHALWVGWGQGDSCYKGTLEPGHRTKTKVSSTARVANRNWTRCAL